MENVPYLAKQKRKANGRLQESKHETWNNVLALSILLCFLNVMDKKKIRIHLLYQNENLAVSKVLTRVNNHSSTEATEAKLLYINFFWQPKQ